MLRRLLLLAAAAGFCATAPGQRHGSGTTTLAVRVDPDARLNVSSVPLTFAVPGTGSVTATLVAWARPLPGQRVRLVATPVGALAGAAGTIPLTAISWNGAKSAARGGGATATCTAGTIGTGEFEFAAGWTRPGTLTCSVTFTLQEAARFAPGVYNGTLLTALRME